MNQFNYVINGIKYNNLNYLLLNNNNNKIKDISHNNVNQ